MIKHKRTNFRNIILKNKDLSDMNFCGCDLSGSDLSGSTLINTNFKCADLVGANLSGASLIGADLSNADLHDSNLSGADLIGANLQSAFLYNANLSNIITDHTTIGYNMYCPEEGSFIGYEKVKDYIVKLLILEDSKRCSATSARCRCDKAKVLDIKNINTGKRINQIISDRDEDLIYKINEIVSVEDFNENRWLGLAEGINFFMNIENAINY